MSSFAQHTASIDNTSIPNISKHSKMPNATQIKIHSLQVIDSEGFPLSHATVAALNSSTEIVSGEVTDTTGYVVLKLTEEVKLIRISYIGYQTIEIPVKELNDDPIELSSIDSQLSEVVVAAPNVKSSITIEGMFGYRTTEKSKNKPDIKASSPSKLDIFPNPSLGRSSLKSDLLLEAKLINIYASSGQLVQSLPVPTGSEDEIQLELSSNHANGIYVVELIRKNGAAEVAKWVVAR